MYFRVLRGARCAAADLVEWCGLSEQDVKRRYYEQKRREQLAKSGGERDGKVRPSPPRLSTLSAEKALL